MESEVSSILLKNTTGRKSGFFMRYEYGEDLFGYLYLDIVRGKMDCAKRVKTHLFDDVRDFVVTLDLELYRKESLNYIPSGS